MLYLVWHGEGWHKTDQKGSRAPVVGGDYPLFYADCNIIYTQTPPYLGRVHDGSVYRPVSLVRLQNLHGLGPPGRVGAGGVERSRVCACMRARGGGEGWGGEVTQSSLPICLHLPEATRPSPDKNRTGRNGWSTEATKRYTSRGMHTTTVGKNDTTNTTWHTTAPTPPPIPNNRTYKKPLLHISICFPCNSSLLLSSERGGRGRVRASRGTKMAETEVRSEPQPQKSKSKQMLKKNNAPQTERTLQKSLPLQDSTKHKVSSRIHQVVITENEPPPNTYK